MYTNCYGDADASSQCIHIRCPFYSTEITQWCHIGTRKQAANRHGKGDTTHNCPGGCRKWIQLLSLGCGETKNVLSGRGCYWWA